VYAPVSGSSRALRTGPLATIFSPPLKALLVAAAVVLAAGCGPQDRSAPGLYRAYCARCHGADGRGNARALRLHPRLDLTTSPMVLAGDRGTIRSRIVEGYGPMPGFARRLSRQELEQLVDFTLQFRPRKAGT
jgi:mono/diheme cytochrome c family protein